MTGNLQLNELEPYIPSSSEKKQAVMMYMAVGLVLSMGKREVSPYTHHHIKQSLGWLVFLMLTIFADLILVILGLILTFFLWIAVLITIPALTIGFMGMHQATKGNYIWENEATNKFFAFFSGIGNWVLNLFDANHYQIIDGERYRTEEQFYPKNPQKNEENSDSPTNNPSSNEQNTQSNSVDSGNQVNNGVNGAEILDIQNHEINNDPSSTKTLDNDQQISINNQDIGIDLSGHEINDEGNFKLDL